MKRRVKDVMTTTVVTAETWTPFKTLARTLATAGVSAVPILDRNGWVVGVVSEGDLLLKEEAQAPDRRSARRLFGRRDRRKARGLVARDVMSSPVATIAPEATLAGAARTMHERGVKRLPVVDREARLVGIVSRQDLVKIFLREDREIREEILDDVLGKVFCIDPATVRVQVTAGLVGLDGTVERKSFAEMIVDFVRAVDGVVDVESHLSYELDDSRLKPESWAPPGVLPWAWRQR